MIPRQIGPRHRHISFAVPLYHTSNGDLIWRFYTVPGDPSLPFEHPELKEAVKIPVIGNGDINCLDDYKRIIDTTGCDGAMIARGALGNPWIFKEINSYILNQKIEKNINLKDRFNLCKQHYQLLKKDKTEHVCLNLTKKHFSWYLKGFNGASDWRKKFMYSQSVNEIELNLENFEKYVS